MVPTANALVVIFTLVNESEIVFKNSKKVTKSKT